MKNTMKFVVSAAVAAVCAVGCGGQSGTQEAPKSVAQNLGPNGEFYGSDTLKEALIAADVQSGAGLTVEGRGSGVGEGCLRNGSTGFCTAAQQALAPMSRDLKAGTCAGGTASTGACCPGEKSNVIALDAVNAWVNSGNSLTNLSTTDLRRIFFATDDKGVAITGACPTNWSAVGGTSGTIVKYRRDDLSGTTDTFKSLLKGGTFCSGVTVVSDGSLPAACAGLSNATACIGKLTATTANAIGYSGDSARTTGNKALSLNNIAPTAATVRNLITNPSSAYPLARQLFLNENVNTTRSAEEQALYDWVYSTNTADFENILAQQGFITCSDISPLDCGGDGLGRGAGVCQ
ncbi:substrate-binding domain-containing protein [Archangium lansingense]|uniref:substrate-binding domain-containing protein n=1 Tax=Archangium lansingense TaxID=2995310 RepID=UPI003B82B27F